MSDLLEYALRYAEAGFAVFPCKPGGKIPMTAHGVLDASCDVGTIEGWWNATPDANIGLATNGIFVVDVDGRDNPWPGRDLSMNLAGYPQSITPRGKHIFFGIPEGMRWKNSVGRLSSRVDTRSDGGYVIVPPSQVDGKMYRWVEGNELV